MDNPLVTVGLQFYNNESTLHLAINSILSQSYQNWELVLHNDGSQDGSIEVAQKYKDTRIRLFSDGLNKKRSARLNESLRLAQGKYYAVMDGDDVSYPNRLITQVEYLEKHPSIDLLGSSIIVFGQSGVPVGKIQPPTDHKVICSKPWAGFPMAQPTFMGRTDWFKKYYYDIRALGGTEDHDLLLRAYRYSRFANLPIILVGYRELGLFLNKILMRRIFSIQNFIRQFKLERRPDLLVRAIGGQGLKAIADIFAIGSGLDYRILRHRARSISDDGKQEWGRVWGFLNPEIVNVL